MIAGDLNRATVAVVGKIGSVKIGGSIIGSDSAADGGVRASGDIGPVTVRGSIVGGGMANSGFVDAGGALAKFPSAGR